MVEVLSGLKGDETLASSNLSQLATGTSVRTGQNGDAAAAPGGGGRRGGNGGRARGTNEGGR